MKTKAQLATEHRTTNCKKCGTPRKVGAACVVCKEAYDHARRERLAGRPLRQRISPKVQRFDPLAWCRANYIKNREKILAANAAWVKRNPTKAAQKYANRR